MNPRKDPLSQVLVDLVLVVGRVVTWPLVARARGAARRDGCTKRGRWLHASPRDFASQLFESGHSAYVFNFADAETTGTHCCTSLACYYVIVGRAEATAQALLGLQTSFLPLGREGKSGAVSPVAIGPAELGSDWVTVAEFLESSVRPVGAHPKGGHVVEFSDISTAEKLCRAAINSSQGANGRSGVVAVPPLTPAAPLSRWDHIHRVSSLLLFETEQ